MKIKTKEIDSSLAERYPPVILEILKNRGIESAEEVEGFFDYDYDKNLADPLLILGMEEALGRISKARLRKEKVAIFGDYDADGVTAAVVLKETLEELGLEEVFVYIPDRQTEGYGVNKKAIEYLRRKGVTLVITVDCGISNYAEIEEAKKNGLDFIVTDHHHIPERIPDAVAVINPHLEKSNFVPEGKGSDLAGVGVAFKLAQAIYNKFFPEKIEQLKWSLDLVAIGTIADCVSLLGENRVLVKYGLIVLSKTRRAGILEMFQVGRINISENNVPDAHAVAFQIAPRINAAGRMDHANAAYKLLLEKDRSIGRVLALELEEKNQQRQKVTAEITREVQIIANNLFKDKKAILVENEHWPVGVLGLVAGKIAEEFGKPTAILQKKETEYVGSLRSIPQIDIMEVLEECRGCLASFGGHAQAAGVRVSHENIETFLKKFLYIVEKKMDGREVAHFLQIDAEISSEEIDWDLVAALEKMEPFGMGNPEPVFCSRSLVVVETKIVGNGQKHLKMALRAGKNSPKIFDSIGFSLGEKFSNFRAGDIIDVVFNLNADEWNGSKKIQLKLLDIKNSNQSL